MYPILLSLHNYGRWLVLLLMIYALFRAWWGILAKRPWTRADDLAALAYTWGISLQFIIGLMLYLLPEGFAYMARQNFGVALRVPELRFFALEHPLQMIIGLSFVHLGSARARRSHPAARQFGWAVSCFTISTLLIVTAIPWWRPLLRDW